VGNLLFSKGEWVVNDELGDEGKVLRDVTTADKIMDVDFDGEIDKVSVTAGGANDRRHNSPAHPRADRRWIAGAAANRD
jgi:hypothetical protein